MKPLRDPLLACEVRTGAGPTVVLVHGIPGAGAAWSRTVSALPPERAVLVPDLLGFGASPPPTSYSADELGPEPQSRWLERLLDDRAGAPVVLVGHDYGAPVSILLASRRPDLVSSLVLLAGNAFPDTPIPFPLSLVATPAVSGPASRMLFSRSSLRLMLRQGIGGGAPPEAATYLGDRGQQRAIATIFREALRRLEETYAPVASALAELTCPVVVGWGDRDPFFPLAQGQRTAETAGAQLRVFPGAGHFLPHECPDDVARLIAGC